MKSLHILSSLIFTFVISSSYAVDIYDQKKNQITIPFVAVGNTIYKNVIATVGQVLSVGNAKSSISKPSTTLDVFNLDTGILSISSVQVGTTTYNDVDLTIQNVISLESFASVANNITQRVEILPPSGYDLLPFMVQGRFKETGVNYVLVAGWLNKGNCWLNTNGVLTQICETANPDAPVKVFSIDSDGNVTDATTDVLGGPQTAGTNIPLVADFNGDGIDDIFLAGFKDGPASYNGKVFLTEGVVFLSRAGKSHTRTVLPGSTWSHGVGVVDIDNDGDLDVVNSAGQIWINDGKGGFTFQDHKWNLNTKNGLWINGSGVCSGDFNSKGRNQVVITDLMVNGNGGPIADTVIFEFDSDVTPFASHALPVPIPDRLTNQEINEQSHDVACAVADLNGDGKLDIVVSNRPNDRARNGRWTDEGNVQILMNNGNWNFTDRTDTALVGYNTNVAVSYIPLVQDFNGDGFPDLWLSNFDFTTGRATSAWKNDGTGNFKQVLAKEIESFGSTGQIIPIKFGSKFSFVYMTGSGPSWTINASKPLYSFN
jgi:hypothetical protein